MSDTYPGEDRDLALARRFAPVFHQRLAAEPGTHRFDSITNFDFDGDWMGNNNWEHAADSKFPMKGYVYYSVIETESHYFLTYAAFHARDWSFVQPLMDGGMERVQQSERLGKYLPPALRDNLEVNHENDLEGAQVIVAKDPELRVVAVETVAHNKFERYPAEELLLDGQRPQLYVEALKHGIYSFPHQGQRLSHLFDAPDGPIRVYRFKGAAEDPEKTEGDVGYNLIPLYSTLWKRARNLSEPNQTFGEITDFGDIFCQALGKPAAQSGALCRLAKVGTALRGDVAGKNRATLPWGWVSHAEPELGPGAWFLDPARVWQLHYAGESPTGRYLSNPFLGLFRADTQSR